MRKIGKKKLIVGGVAAAVIAAGAGTALAYWTSTGTGSGNATTGSSTALNVVVDNSDAKNLTPGGPKQTVSFHVTNPSSGHQNFSNAVATVTGTDKAGCGPVDFAITNLTAAYGDLASNATANGSFDLQMVNDTARNQDACQNATVTVKVDAS